MFGVGKNKFEDREVNFVGNILLARIKKLLDGDSIDVGVLPCAVDITTGFIYIVMRNKNCKRTVVWSFDLDRDDNTELFGCYYFKMKV